MQHSTAPGMRVSGMGKEAPEAALSSGKDVKFFLSNISSVLCCPETDNSPLKERGRKEGERRKSHKALTLTSPNT